jgi:hypothetical protein
MTLFHKWCRMFSPFKDLLGNCCLYASPLHILFDVQHFNFKSSLDHWTSILGVRGGGLLLGTVQSLRKICDMNQSKMPITEEKVELWQFPH